MWVIALAYVTVVFVASLVSFVMYGWDKMQAGRDGRRIPERTLQLTALLGGWPGAWIGQQVFRHKTRKRSFQIRYWAIVLLHLGLIIAWIYTKVAFNP